MAKIQLTDTHGVKTLFRWLHQTKKSIWHQVAGESFLFAWIKLNSLNHMLLFSSGSQTSNILMEKQIFKKVLPEPGPVLHMYLFLPALLSVGLVILSHGWGNWGLENLSDSSWYSCEKSRTPLVVLSLSTPRMQSSFRYWQLVSLYSLYLTAPFCLYCFHPVHLHLSPEL